MTKYLDKVFSVPVGDSKAYRDNYDAIFNKKKSPVDELTEQAQKMDMYGDPAAYKPKKRKRAKK